jgi:hypothetical protein
MKVSSASQIYLSSLRHLRQSLEVEAVAEVEVEVVEVAAAAVELLSNLQDLRSQPKSLTSQLNPAIILLLHL